MLSYIAIHLNFTIEKTLFKYTLYSHYCWYLLPCCHHENPCTCPMYTHPGCSLEIGLLDMLGNSKLCPKMILLVYSPSSSGWEFPYSAIFSMCYCPNLNFCLSVWCEIVFYYAFSLRFLGYQGGWAFSDEGPTLFCEMHVHLFPFFPLWAFVFPDWFVGDIYTFWILILCQLSILQIAFQFNGLAFYSMWCLEFLIYCNWIYQFLKQFLWGFSVV